MKYVPGKKILLRTMKDDLNKEIHHVHASGDSTLLRF